MVERIRVAVVGVGHLGSRHARVYSEEPGAELVAVVDVDQERARSIAEAHGARWATDLSELPSGIEAASVAVPTESHLEVAKRLLEIGVHVLVEKPLASSLEDGQRMVALAAERGLVLAAGHTERHNPAVQALVRECRDPRFIEVHRLGSFSPRSLDIDVVLDLMIHDLDVVSALVGTDVLSLEAVGVPVLTSRVDIANARLRFAGGAVANLTASRVSQEKIRKLRVFERERYVSLDYQSQEAISYRRVPSERSPPEIVRESLPVARDEPLRLELLDFLTAVRTGGRPLVRGEEALRALSLALQVAQEIRENRETQRRGGAE